MFVSDGLIVWFIGWILFQFVCWWSFDTLWRFVNWRKKASNGPFALKKDLFAKCRYESFVCFVWIKLSLDNYHIGYINQIVVCELNKNLGRLSYQVLPLQLKNACMLKHSCELVITSWISDNCAFDLCLNSCLNLIGICHFIAHR